MTHTQGEWKENNNSISVEGHGYIAKALPIYMDKEQRKANAQLIASAPDLLKALKTALYIIDDIQQDVLLEESDYQEDLISINEALNKAEGVNQ